MTERSTVKSRLQTLRKKMRELGLDAYLVPSTDPHQSEYLPDCWQRREWISGFTGSAGDVVVTLKGGGLWTDGRYFLQAEQELKGSGLKLYRQGASGVPTLKTFLKGDTHSQQPLRVGVDLQTISHQRFGDFAKDGVDWVATEQNLVDASWKARPALPVAELSRWPNRFAGQTPKQKLKAVRSSMKQAGVQALVVSMLDEIAWLFNIRGADVPFNPVCIGYALVELEQCTLFVDVQKIKPADRKALEKFTQIVDYQQFSSTLRRYGQKQGTKKVWLDPKTVSAWIAEHFKKEQRHLQSSPVMTLKACKNPTEIQGIQSAHERDGVAVTKFLCWLDSAVPKGGVDEISAAAKLQTFRTEQEHYKGPSFETISGYGPHGAIIHYRVDEQSNIPLKSKGIYLVDSGGQYLDGTTDITRTVLLGKRAAKNQKETFTRVLKGHIAIAQARFPVGVTGNRLDTLARMALWHVGLDYAHGTGHGVGAYLYVHEGPCGIHQRGPSPLQAGNIVSNEPGYYEPGAYGIRIENLVLIREAEKQSTHQPFLEFATLTLAPIDLRLIEPKLLTHEEKGWLNRYHGRVLKTLAPHLSTSEKRWLRQATKRIA